VFGSSATANNSIVAARGTSSTPVKSDIFSPTAVSCSRFVGAQPPSDVCHFKVIHDFRLASDDGRHRPEMTSLVALAIPISLGFPFDFTSNVTVWNVFTLFGWNSPLGQIFGSNGPWIKFFVINEIPIGTSLCEAAPSVILLLMRIYPTSSAT
jgi:hypothetical protein